MRKKRLLSILLCGVLSMNMLPAAAQAAESKTPVVDIEVNGEKLSETNRYEVNCGEGTARYDVEEQKLILENAEITKCNLSKRLLSANQDLTIQLIGTNRIENEAGVEGTQGIMNWGNLIFTGEGTLTVKGGANSIWSTGDVTIDQTTLTVNGAIQSTGIEAANVYVKNGSELTVTCESQAIGQPIQASENVSIQDSTVTAISYSDSQSAVYCDDFQISGGTVVLKGGTQGNGVYANSIQIKDKAVLRSESGYPALYSTGNAAVEDATVEALSTTGTAV